MGNKTDTADVPDADHPLLLLAARCEHEEPSRELDAEIMFSLFAKPAGENGFLWPEDNTSWSFAIRFPNKDKAWFDQVRKGRPSLLVWRNGHPILVNDLRVKPVTASLDAAVTLVPEGYRIARLEDMLIGRWDANLREIHSESGHSGGEWTYRDVVSQASTPALALCSASLRARAAMSKTVTK